MLKTAFHYGQSGVLVLLKWRFGFCGALVWFSYDLGLGVLEKGVFGYNAGFFIK